MSEASEVVREWLEAMERRDESAVLERMAEDVTMRVEGVEQPLRGKEPLRPMFRSFFRACERIRLEPEKTVASGRDVAVLVRARVKLGSDLDILGETLPTRGKELSVRAAFFAHLNEQGAIDELVRIRDSWEIMRQLRLSPERMQSLVREVERELAAHAPS